eukprot:gnl/Spiro4/24496_TR12136_c0_g1_i1.p2 gnl/Spiro4/24496_TR12136_c0_g1~~gnl/Spiro4/24496_TR12136_c0_g1_i1.p2  ORF type:complete len:268 (+),score=52.34 gnl/Spiro4/24496_TR12136_c0_g1_i1:57-806(+)
MKIVLNIEIDVTPDELSLSSTTELVAILQRWAENKPGVSVSAGIPAFSELISRLDPAHREKNPNALDEVVARLNAIFGSCSDSFELDAMIKNFLYELYAVIFDTKVTEERKSAIPYIEFLPRLADGFRQKILPALVRDLLAFLTHRRAVDAPRVEFFGHAEVFAVLVQWKLVLVTAAVNAITQLIQKEYSRCAGVTMLGKTVELCQPLLIEECNPASLELLREALSKVTEPSLHYDRSYIENNMHWASG